MMSAQREEDMIAALNKHSTALNNHTAALKEHSLKMERYIKLAPRPRGY